MPAKKPSTPSERTAARRADLVKQGWAQKNWLLPPAALADLAALVKRTGGTEVEAITSALREANGRSELSDAELARMVSRRLIAKG